VLVQRYTIAETGQFLSERVGVAMMHRYKVIVGFLRIALVCLVLTGTLGAVASTAQAATLLPAPTLISPSNGATGVSTRPNFSWSAVPGANYYWLTVATNPAYLPTDPNAYGASDCVIGSNGIGISNTSYTPASGVLSQGTTYYWEVQAYHGSDALHPDQQGNYSSQWQFTTASAVTLLPAPALVSPSDGATGVSTTPTFQWSSVSGADYYGLYIRDITSGEGPIVFDSEVNYGPIYGTSLNLPSGYLSSGKTYRWNMRSHNSAGWGTSFSTGWTFSTQAPQPAISYSPSSLNFTTTQGGVNPPSQTLNIWNSGSGSLNWSISDDALWLTLGPSSGTSTGETDAVTASVSISDMSSGSYNATIIISASGATNTPRTVAVSLTISQAQETVTTPNTPTGPTNGQVNQSLAYSTSGASSNLGHSPEYRFDWGDSNYSSWSSLTTASHSWSTQGTYTVRSQARCSTHTSIVSGWSSALSVNITAPNQYTLTLNISGQGTTDPVAGTYTYNQGTQVAITASAASGWKFDHWGGDASGTSTSTTITMNSNKSVVAYFQQEIVSSGSISVNSNPSGASFSLSGPTSYSGVTPWSVDNAPAGNYTITWEAISSYATPSLETRNLPQDGSISFYGSYQATPLLGATLRIPNTIRVLRVSSGQIEEVDFQSYVKSVLPNEWYASWDMNALRAGAMAVKTYAWYWCINQKYPGKGYDVRDDAWDQIYKPGTLHTRTNLAVDETWGWIMTRQGNIFQAQYIDGTQGSPDPISAETGKTYLGRMSQWGTQYLAENGKDWQSILRYYYDPIEIVLPESSNVNAGPENIPPEEAPQSIIEKIQETIDRILNFLGFK
jgi:hypothetical protein